jgi:manganese/zinc/iron transport system substrate-binding protein
MRNIRRTALLLAVLPLALLTGCPAQLARQPGTPPPGGYSAAEPLRVVCTTGMIADVAEDLGGEYVDVYWMMGAGVDPHLYQAKPSDLDALIGADLIFYNGLHLEASLARVLERIALQRTAVAVSHRIPEDSLHHPPAFEGYPDPHIWFDVTLWEQAAEAIRGALCEADPPHAEYFNSRAESYQAQLRELDSYVLARAEELPLEQRVLVTAHDAFGYFGARYGFDVRGLQGISTDAEAGTGDVQQLARFIAERKLRAIFVESSVPARNVEAVQAAVRARGWEVAIGGELYSDAMGSAGTVDGTYLGMVRHNINTIVDALAAQPQAGKAGPGSAREF